jgi:hypothetical protein
MFIKQIQLKRRKHGQKRSLVQTLPLSVLNIKYPYSESYFNTMQDIIPPRTTDKYKYTGAGVYCAVGL